MKLYRPENIKLLTRAVVADEYSDEYQNMDAYEGKTFAEDEFVSFSTMFMVPGKILEIGCGCNPIKVLPVTHAIEPHPVRAEIARLKLRNVKIGIIEAIPYPRNYFSTVLCHGAWCFVRSELESLMEVNRVLKKGGVFIFDIVERTNLPIARTDSIENLSTRADSFGFNMTGRLRYNKKTIHEMSVVSLEKLRDFDWHRLRVPQCKGTISNYVEDRDWYLR